MAPSVFIRKHAVQLFVLAAVLIAAPALAAGPGSGPCAEDLAKYCKDVQPGGGRLVKCMKEHQSDLSPACKQHLAEMKERAKEAKEACQDDVMNFCKDVKPGGGRIIGCLKQHESELSADCKAQMEKKARKKASR